MHYKFCYDMIVSLLMTDVFLSDAAELIADEHKSTGSTISFPHGNSFMMFIFTFIHRKR